ncbi:MAG: hypothetical protein U1E76_22065 [Planctomycetota bacterium]
MFIEVLRATPRLELVVRALREAVAPRWRDRHQRCRHDPRAALARGSVSSPRQRDGRRARACFRARHQEVAVAHVLPTLDLIVDFQVERQRNLWCDEFADLRPQLAAEIRELISQCLLLKTARER